MIVANCRQFRKEVGLYHVTCCMFPSILQLDWNAIANSDSWLAEISFRCFQSCSAWSSVYWVVDCQQL